MLNTDLRKAAQTDFEKDFFKLMNNAVSGKTMENVRQRTSLRLLRAEDEEVKLLRAIAKPSFERSILFDCIILGFCSINSYIPTITSLAFFTSVFNPCLEANDIFFCHLSQLQARKRLPMSSKKVLLEY